MFRSKRRQVEQHDPADALVREVGVHLREARMARGEELEQVAANLRIRLAYLRALEQGDLSVMPGRTYALGFLRSYARYLGFDADDLIAQIRSSVAGLTGQGHLHDRTPLAESRLPKLPILVISLAALAGIYAGWAYVDHRNEAEIDLVDEVPGDLRQEAGAPVLTPAPEAEARIEPLVEPPVEPAAEPQAGAAERLVARDAEPSDEGAADPPSVPTDGPPLQAVQEGTAVPERATLEAEESELPDPGTPAVTPEPPSHADEAALAPAPSAGEPSGPDTAPDPAAPLAADVPAALAPGADGEATTYRGGDTAGRVILRARTSAWVHVSSTNNDYLWVRTLQPGDAFAVPDRPGLVLWTGNAGGIEVIVDGTPLPPLGPEARVVRDVSLQADDLLRRLQPAAGGDTASQPESR
jgi:cytoskeleton protein RodZ